MSKKHLKMIFVLNSFYLACLSLNTLQILKLIKLSSTFNTTDGKLITIN